MTQHIVRDREPESSSYSKRRSVSAEGTKPQTGVSQVWEGRCWLLTRCLTFSSNLEEGLLVSQEERGLEANFAGKVEKNILGRAHGRELRPEGKGCELPGLTAWSTEGQVWPGLDHTGCWRSCSVFFFYPESHRRRGMTGSGWKCLQSPLWLHSGEQVGKLGKAKHYWPEGGCGLGSAERGLEWLVTLGVTKVAKFQRDKGRKIQTVTCRQQGHHY